MKIYIMAAVAIQCLLRHMEADKTMAFHDWVEKVDQMLCIDDVKRTPPVGMVFFYDGSMPHGQPVF